MSLLEVYQRDTMRSNLINYLALILIVALVVGRLAYVTGYDEAYFKAHNEGYQLGYSAAERSKTEACR